MLIFRRASACAPHSDSSYGGTYDSHGKGCDGLTSDERIALGAGLGFLVAAFWLGRWTRRRLKRRRMDDRQTPKRRLLTPSPSSSRPVSRMQTPSPDITPLSKAQQPPPRASSLSSPNAGAPSIPTTPTRMTTLPQQPFHMPMLSARGDLLPPPVPSSRFTFGPTVAPNQEPRPLPPAPLDPFVNHNTPGMRSTFSAWSPAAARLPLSSGRGRLFGFGRAETDDAYSGGVMEPYAGGVLDHYTDPDEESSFGHR